MATFWRDISCPPEPTISWTEVDFGLKGFKKVALAPGETKRVNFEIDPDMLKFYDPERGWVLEEGGFTAYVGAASDDIRSIVKFNI